MESPCYSLWNPLVRLILHRTETLDLQLCSWGTKPRPISLHPLIHLVFPPTNCCKGHWLQGFQHIILQRVKHVITIITEIFLTCAQNNSMKFNSQWNFGKNRHKCPTASMVSWTKDFCSAKSACCLRICLLQQSALSTPHLLLHFPQRCAWYRPRSVSTILMPLGWFEYWGWLAGNTIDCPTFWPSWMNQPSCMCACFPLGLTFIRETSKTSSEYAECPCELSIRNSPW